MFEDPIIIITISPLMGLLVAVLLVVFGWLFRDPLTRLIDRLSILIVQANGKNAVFGFDSHQIEMDSLQHPKKELT